MPNLIDLKVQVPDKARVVADLKEILALGEKLENLRFSIGDNKGGLADYKKQVEELKKTQEQLTTATDKYTQSTIKADKALQQAAKTREQIAKADLAELKLSSAKEDASARLTKKIEKQTAAQEKLNAANEITVVSAPGNNTDVLIEENRLTQQQTSALQEQLAAQAEAEYIQSRSNAGKKEEIAESPALIAAREKLALATSKENVQLQGLALERAEANKAAKAEASAALGLDDAYKQLNIEYEIAQREAKNLAIESANVTKQYGKNSTQAREAAAAAKASANNALALNTQIKAIDKSVGQAQKNVGNYTSAFGKAFGAIRQAAYILPGIGIAGIFSLIGEAIGSLISKLDLFGSKTSIITKTFKDTDENSASLRDSLSELGTTADEIADKAILNLDASIKKLNDDIGLTPSVIEQARAALKLLQTEAAETQKVLDEAKTANKTVDLSGTNQAIAVQVYESKKLAENAKKQSEVQLKINEATRKQNQKDQIQAGKEQLELNTKILSDNLQLDIDANEKVIGNDKKTYDERIAFLRKNFALTQELNIIERNKGIALAGESEAKKEQVAEDYRYKNLKSIADFAERERALRQKEADDAAKEADRLEKERLARAKKRNDLARELQLADTRLTPKTISIDFDKEVQDRIKAKEDALAHELSIVQQEASAEEEILNKKYSDGAIGEEEYQKLLAKIKEKAARETLEKQKGYADAELKILESRGLGATAQADKLREAIAAANAELAKTPKAVDDGLLRAQKILEEVASAIQTVGQLLSDAANIGFTKEMNNLQAIEDARQKNYEQEVARINGSTLSEEDKANRLKVLEATRQAQEQEFERKQRDAKIRQARLDKAINIANIIGRTALAVVTALATPGVGIGQAIAAGAIGAAELAIAIATPIPTYAQGLDKAAKDHMGIYGEDGLELISKPGQKPYLSNNATYDFIPRGTSITPLTGDYLNAALNREMLAHGATVLGMKAVPQEQRDLSGAILQELKKANKKTTRVTTNAVVDLGWTSYVSKQVRGRA